MNDEEARKFSDKGFYISHSLVQAGDAAAVLTLFNELIKERDEGKDLSGRRHYEMKENVPFMQSPEVYRVVAQAKSVSEFLLQCTNVYLSTIQVVNSEPGNTEQLWHVDNSMQGVTLIYPLVDVTQQNGSTELIAGSQHLNTPEMQWRSLEVIKPYMKVGQAMTMDSRLLHRGMCNKSIDFRPILVVRFDHRKTPPPTIGTFNRGFNFILTNE